MKCVCCDKNLSDYESTIKSKVTGQYLDTCTVCLKEAGITSFKDRKDLCPTQEIDPEDTEDYEE
jgi:hypothetical protein